MSEGEFKESERKRVMIEELEQKLAMSERLRENIEFIKASMPKVDEVFAKLGKIEETGLAPIQKALDEIEIIKQHQTDRHAMLVELEQLVKQVPVRDAIDDDLLRDVLKLLRDRLAKR